MDENSLFIGEKLRLAAPLPEDNAIIARWTQDSRYLRLLDDDPARPFSEQTVAEDKPGKYHFHLRTLDDDKLIGFVALFSFRWTHGSAMFAISIGEPDYRGKGYGQDALRLLLNYVFRELNLYRLGLTVFSYNTAAIRAYERAGFRHEGTIRGAIKRDGQRYDELLYGITVDEWRTTKSTSPVK